MFGLSTKDVRKLAYDFLKSNPYLTIPFNKKTQVAGKKWHYLVVKRHPSRTQFTSPTKCVRCSQ
jgi:hypothetical protein